MSTILNSFKDWWSGENNYGRLISWTEENKTHPSRPLQLTRAVVRDDGYIFQNTKETRPLSHYEKINYASGLQVDGFFRGSTIDGNYYDGYTIQWKNM